jgi:hypothetical protein
MRYIVFASHPRRHRARCLRARRRPLRSRLVTSRRPTPKLSHRVSAVISTCEDKRPLSRLLFRRGLDALLSAPGRIKCELRESSRRDGRRCVTVWWRSLRNHLPRPAVLREEGRRCSDQIDGFARTRPPNRPHPLAAVPRARPTRHGEDVRSPIHEGARASVDPLPRQPARKCVWCPRIKSGWDS